MAFVTSEEAEHVLRIRVSLVQIHLILAYFHCFMRCVVLFNLEYRTEQTQQ